MTFPRTTSLDGAWQMLPIDSFRQGFYRLEDDAWLEQQLPAHWQQHPLLERYAGKMVYRKRFTLDHRPPTTDHRPPTTEPERGGEGERGRGGENGKDVADDRRPTTDDRPPAADRPSSILNSQFSILNSQFLPPSSILHPPSSILNPRYWLRLNGIFYWSQPYFNGVDLGRHEGYFAPQEHEVTAWVAAENILLVEVDCPEEHDKFHKRLITGVFSHWDCLDPTTNPGGIWQPVELIATGPTRVKELLLETESAEVATARLRFRAVLDAASAAEVTLRWTVAPKNFAGEVQVIEQRRRLAGGTEEIDGQFHVRDPQLWWTHDLGHPSCYTVMLAVVQDGELSDEYATTFGIRRFELRNWIAYLNGTRFFIKGNNYAPGDTRIATMTRERYDHDLRMARECHMNMLRVHAHVEHPAFYEAADQAGILLWQDFPLQWIYRREVLPEAQRQARHMVRLLYNHPSVALWCMHNEPIFIADTTDERVLTQLRIGISAFIWSWNRDVMDSQLKRDVEREDPTRPAVRASGEYAVPLIRSGTDSHFYMGWYSRVYGPLRFWEPIARHFPNTIRFVTEFGAQSFPNLESCLKFMDADVANIDWEYMTARHQFQPGILEHSLPWRSVRELEELVELTQSYQVAINRFYIDRLRFYKYRPTGGIIPFMFHDPNPAISFSIIDYWRVPKRAYAAMREAFSPQYLFTLIDKDHYRLGVPIDLPIYVINDAHHDVPAELSARLTDPNGVELARIDRVLTLPADCMATEIERLRLTPDLPGAYRLSLALRDAEQDLVEHEYVVIISPTLEATGHVPTVIDRLKAEV